MRKTILAAVIATALLLPPCAVAQVRVTHEGWEGFSTRPDDGKVASCVLYNRSIDAINTAPYDMLGLSREGSGQIGLLIFYRPRMLTRGTQVPVTLKVDQRAPIVLRGDVISDFHVKVAGPLEQQTVEALRQAKTIAVTTEGQTQAFQVSGLGGVFDALAACANPHPP
jgi:hypothetical protein